MPGTVGFIGLGAMGDPMALNLGKRGLALVVQDIDPAKAERWRTRGATLAPSPAEVAAKADRTICMVETTAQAGSVIAGERGIIHLARAGHIVACMSTIDPFVAPLLAAKPGGRGIPQVE